MPLGLATITSAFEPKTSVTPLRLERLLPVTSLTMILAEPPPTRLGLDSTLPPMMEVPPSPELFRISPRVSILYSRNLLWLTPPLDGLTMFSVGVPLPEDVTFGRNSIGAVGSVMTCALAGANELAIVVSTRLADVTNAVAFLTSLPGLDLQISTLTIIVFIRILPTARAIEFVFA